LRFLFEWWKGREEGVQIIRIVWQLANKVKNAGYDYDGVYAFNAVKSQTPCRGKKEIAMSVSVN
jgi:hypothetical protein